MSRVSETEKALVALSYKDNDSNLDEETKSRNRDAVLKIFDTLNKTEDFEVGFSNAVSGKLLVCLNSHMMLVEITQLTDSDGKTLKEQFRENNHLLY